MSEREEARDLERAEEYELMYSRGALRGGNKFELSTGLIIAARFADKLRRVAIVALSKMVPKDVIIRDVSELNMKLHNEIVEKRKIGKLDIIKITVNGYYDQGSNKIIWEDYKILRYISEDEYNKLLKENEILRTENTQLKGKIEEIKKILG
ncbi:MAG: DUF2258 domain-containing protein [Thermoprotei archaeon]|jgi:hypothetical protein